MVEGRILKVSGPLVIAEGMREANMFDVVRVGEARLVGEIIEMHGDRASIQVYEETAGIGRGDRVVSTGAPLSVELGPGLIGSIYDGIQRPLETMKIKYGSNITKGIDEPALSRERTWRFEPAVSYGDEVSEGDVYGYVQESAVMRHKILVPPGVRGTIADIRAGEFTVTEEVGKLRLQNGEFMPITLSQKWPPSVRYTFTIELTFSLKKSPSRSIQEAKGTVIIVVSSQKRSSSLKLFLTTDTSVSSVISISRTQPVSSSLISLRISSSFIHF